MEANNFIIWSILVSFSVSMHLKYEREIMSDTPVPSEEVRKPLDQQSETAPSSSFNPEEPEGEPADEQIEEETTDPESELLEKILALRDMVLSSTDNVECLLFTAKLKGSNNPAVAISGEQLDVTELSVAVATNLRRKVIDRIGGGR